MQSDRARQVEEVVLHGLMRPGEAAQKGAIFSCDINNEREADREEVLGKPSALALKHMWTEGGVGRGTG